MSNMIKKILTVSIAYFVVASLLVDDSFLMNALVGLVAGIGFVVMDHFENHKKVDAEVERMKKLAKDHKK